MSPGIGEQNHSKFGLDYFGLEWRRKIRPIQFGVNPENEFAKNPNFPERDTFTLIELVAKMQYSRLVRNVLFV